VVTVVRGSALIIGLALGVVAVLHMDWIWCAFGIGLVFFHTVTE
jgi:hypothetical protein